MPTWSLCMIVKDEEAVLERCLNSAAARLGISRMTLWRKLHPKEGREDEAEM